MSTSPELSIIVPCLDEEDNVQITLDLILAAMAKAGVDDYEILICDDASTDQTFARSVEYAASHPEVPIRTERRQNPRRGYGAVVRHGIACAHGTFCVPISGDGVDPVDMIPAMLEKARAGAELVQCSRYHQAEHANTIPWSYKTLQFGWRLFVKLITGRTLPDSTYAFKMFRRTGVLSRGITANGFSIGPELFFKTLLADEKIDYVFSGQSVRRHGKSKFYFRRELWGFSYVLGRVAAHRLGILWF